MTYRPVAPYSAITARAPSRWPGNKGLAVYVALGIEEYRPDDGITEDIMPGASKPDLVNRSWRDYGNRVGGFRLIDRLAGFGLPPAILLNTDVYDTARPLLDHARAAGCEMVGHGRTNSDTLATMNVAEEEAYLRSVHARIAQEEGVPPGGWSSPWLAHSPTTLASLVRTGFRYVLDFRLDDQPVMLDTPAGPIMAMPYGLEINDSTTAIGRQTPARDFADMIVDEFDELLLASREQALVMSIVVHSFVSGQPFRLRALTRALEHIAAQREAVWFTQPRHIAAAWAD
jgi:peptidoglycan/xylan/chitin deacetylase (PgdA/CDA1 family)